VIRTVTIYAQQSDSDEDDDNTENAAASSAIRRDNEVYSLVKAVDNENEYAVPKSNVPVNRPSTVPSDRVLYQVIIPSYFVVT